MSLPPGFLDELRDRLTLSAVAGRKVIWDRRKTNAAKGDFWAPCPFHHEKTPSFHVDDRKGFYHCFGCQVSGDAITFVRETENVSFIEAVEILAREAGMQMPEQRHDPQAAERQDRRAKLADVMEQAVQMYGLAFRSAAGQGARDYTAQRGLGAETLKRFEIGFAPDSRNHQAQHFRDKGLLDEAVAAGLLIKPEDGGAPYDRFRNRLMFPIRDPRGRCIAFGGRALSAEAQAKYLNSPETELFHKGRTLYNHGPAREAAGKAGTVIVAEGYMDVIALAAAGFGHAVAPLGTAITEDQLQLIWRIAEEPIVALDGDEAGLRAAERLIDLALPHLAPGRSLRFCLLPEGRDPDDLIRAEGPGAMQRALDAARPLVEMLWLRETGAQPLDTPERRAALDRRLREALKRIGDESVRNHYAADIKARRAELFRPARRSQGSGGAGFVPRGGKGRGWTPPPAPALPETRQSDLARKSAPGGLAEARIREAGILLIACRNPQALEPVEHLLEEMTVHTPEFAALRDALLGALAEGADVAAAVQARIGQDPFELLGRVPQARAHPLARPGRPPERVAEVLAEAIGRHQAALAFGAEIAEAARDLGAAEGEDWTWRVRQAGHLLHEADRRAIAAADEDQDESVSGIQRLLDAEVYKSKKR
ncbi:MAG TPA: DNA primase [Thermohalobaculum sp.]|nr:DNA primase [Thermohalobaculum sp.]